MEVILENLFIAKELNATIFKFWIRFVVLLNLHYGTSQRVHALLPKYEMRA